MIGEKGKTLQWCGSLQGVSLTSSPSSSILSFQVRVPAPEHANKPICGYVKKAISNYAISGLPGGMVSLFSILTF